MGMEPSGQARFQCFGLTLMVNHECNLRCTYCYTGAKFNRSMPYHIGTRAIERACNSLSPGGELQLGFFGGEPLIEAGAIGEWMNFARRSTTQLHKHAQFHLTTNGTVTGSQAWTVMLADDLDLAVSFDGTPEIHDRHRHDAAGKGSANRVIACLRQLSEAGKPYRVVMVVRPDTLAEVPAGLDFLHHLGVRRIDLSLDLWTRWTAGDGVRLRAMINQAAATWRSWLPDGGINWFDVKLAELIRLPNTKPTVRCGFGNGEIAVAPSGHLYPCERLIGEDLADQPLRLPGHALQGDSFGNYSSPEFQACAACGKCSLQFACDTSCRCSNYVRTGDLHRPDGLLCVLNKATAQAIAGVLEGADLNEFINSKNSKHQSSTLTKTCYAC